MNFVKLKNPIRFIWGKPWSRVLGVLSSSDFPLVTATTICKDFQGKED